MQWVLTECGRANGAGARPASAWPVLMGNVGVTQRAWRVSVANAGEGKSAVSEPRTTALPPVTEAVDAEMPWLWWARTDGARLAGMSAPPPGFPFAILEELGLDTIVSLVGPATYDPSPLASHAFTLRDLVGGAAPEDSAAEEAEVRRAVAAIRSLLADGRNVAVHCRAGIGRTGLVIGAVLVSEGHDPATVTAWVNAVQQARGSRGWPESPWQSDLLTSFEPS